MLALAPAANASCRSHDPPRQRTPAPPAARPTTTPDPAAPLPTHPMPDPDPTLVTAPGEVRRALRVAMPARTHPP